MSTIFSSQRSHSDYGIYSVCGSLVDRVKSSPQKGTNQSFVASDEGLRAYSLVLSYSVGEFIYSLTFPVENLLVSIFSLPVSHTETGVIN